MNYEYQNFIGRGKIWQGKKIFIQRSSWNVTFKGTLRPDWICMRVAPLDNPLACSDYGLYVHKPWSFPMNHAPEMRERQQLFFGLRLVSENSIVQSLTVFFHQIKVRQTIGRKNSIQPWSEQAGVWIHFSLKWLRTLKLFQMFRT